VLPRQEVPVPEIPSGPLLGVRDLAKSFGAQALFDRVALNLFPGDRLGVIGPNGSGKTTLLRILAGVESPDAGTCAFRRDVRVGYVPQDAAFPDGATVDQVLRDAAAAAPGHGTPGEVEGLVAETLGRTGFADRHQAAATLSGGWVKRLAIARELVRDPDVLLLDEPTNHLDLPGLLWLEDLLRRARFASLVVSHDRWFLQNVATRMVELNRAYPDGTLAADGPYSDFLEARAAFLAGQARLQETLENRVRREVEWLRRGPKARATKAQYRVDAAHALLDELDEVSQRNAGGTVRFDFGATERRTKRLMTVRDAAKALGGRTLFQGLGFVLSPGMRVGLVGANGSGKTTLLRLLAGDLEPDGGRIETATGLRIVYFDQRREQLDPRQTLKQALSPDGDAVTYRGSPVHVTGWARRFLFRQDQLTTPVGDLSGGEQARVLIARLVVRPADVLLLDEPTNDLDLPTLEVLEDSLADFPGAVVLVTHDRYLLDRVATTVLGLDGAGGAAFYGDYAQWEREVVRARPRGRDAEDADAVRPKAPGGDANPARPRARRLTWQEQRDLETIEARIADAEQSLAEREAALHDPAIATDAARLAACADAAQEARAQVDGLYARWAELERRQAEIAG